MNRQVDIKALVSHIVRGDGLEKCRICMGDTSEGQVYLGDTVMMDGDRAVTLAELLEIITGIEVPLDEILPTGLCSACAQRAIEAGNFRNQCRQATNQWDLTVHLLANSMSTKTENSKMYIVLGDAEVTIVEDLKYLDPNYIAEQLAIEAKAKAVKHKCQCPDCGKKFGYPQQLYSHLKESMDLKRACYVCAEIMARDELVPHLKSKHNDLAFYCKKCPSLLQTRKALVRHLAKAHGPGSCVCGDCGRSFLSKHAFNAHQVVHSTKTCPGCDQVFRNQTCYMHHVKKCCDLDPNKEVHRTKNRVTIEVQNKVNESKKTKVGLRGAAEKICICDYCGKKLAGKKFMAAHMQIVHLKNTHRPCQYCGKFLAAARIGNHLKTHETETLFTCEMCGLIMKSKVGYVQHIRLHTGEKPYSCQYCGDTFSASSRRSAHIRKVHETDKNILKYVCDFCPARFKMPFKLRNHVSKVHNREDPANVPFTCKICMEKFSSYRGLTHHSKKHQQILNTYDFKVYSKQNPDENVKS